MAVIYHGQTPTFRGSLQDCGGEGQVAHPGNVSAREHCARDVARPAENSDNWAKGGARCECGDTAKRAGSTEELGHTVGKKVLLAFGVACFG